MNKARQQANTVACLANLRSIGQGIYLYAGQFQGSLPFSYWDGVTPIGPVPNPNGSASATDWGELIETYGMGKGGGTYQTAVGSDRTMQKVFTCPTALQDAPNMITRKLHYTSHPRLIPILGGVDLYTQSKIGGTPYLKPYKLSSIKRSSDIAMIFDGNQVQALNWNSNTAATNLDDNGLYFSDGYRHNYLLEAAFLPMNAPIDTTNADDPPDTSAGYSIRWRHGHNDTANFLFADGHAGSFRLKLNLSSDAKLLNFYVNYQH